MKILHSWLLDFIETEKSPAELAEVLTNTGTEVNALHTRGFSSEHVVVGRILSSEKHPQADRLSVCQVLTAEGEAPRQIVCGAKNYAVGDHVPVALPGAVLPGGFSIKKSKLRGVTSEGMMCSAKELALAEDAEGLLILDRTTPLGRRVDTLFPQETVYEIEVTSNRPDLLSHRGVARDLVAAGAARWRPFVEPPEVVATITGEAFAIRNDAPEFCSIYTATIFEGVENRESPEWMRQRLVAIGLRPINALVDITNYLLHHIGQPMHVFDLEKLAGREIVIRAAKSGEALECLDGSKIALAEKDFVIADSQRALALAGVVGGTESSVTLETSRVLLEIAHFEPKSVRGMSQRHRISTDSSYRFERGTDPVMPHYARRLALQLFANILGAKPSCVIETPRIEKAQPVIKLRHDRVAKVLGKNCDSAEIRTKLTALGLEGADPVDNRFSQWKVPTFRPDLTREADLIEEIARLTPFDEIPAVFGLTPVPSSPDDALYDKMLSIKRTLTGLGWHEALTPPLTDHTEAAVRLSNPMSSEQTALRSSLMPQLLGVLARNLDAGNTGCKLFTVEKVFSQDGSESLSIALATGGPSHEDQWAEKSRSLDAFDIKAAMTAIGAPLEGRLKILTPSEARSYGLKGQIACAEFPPPPAPAGPHRFTPWNSYPGVRRDVAVIVDRAVTAKQLTSAVSDVGCGILENCWVFDVFTDESGQKIPMQSKSVSLAFVFRAPDRTLTEQEVNSQLAPILDNLKSKTGAVPRQ